MANRHRKKDRFICALCVIMAIVILATAFLLVMELATPYKVSNGFKKEAQARGGLAVEEVAEGNGITLTSYAVQAQADGEEGDALTIDATHKVIEATVRLSDGTTSSNVKWTLAPKAGETLYEDKAVSDYVELKTPTKGADGKYQATVSSYMSGQVSGAICIECKQAFGGVLEVVATSADDETKSATAEINYYKAVESVTITPTSDAGEYIFILGSEENDPLCASNTFRITPKYGVGTKEGTFETVSGSIFFSTNNSVFNAQASTLKANMETVGTKLGISGQVALKEYSFRITDGAVYAWYQDFFILPSKPWSYVNEENAKLLEDGFIDSQNKLITMFTNPNASSVSSIPAPRITATVKYVTDAGETEFSSSHVYFYGFKGNYTAPAAE